MATTLWYTRCPVPSASSIAITRGLLDAEFAADGILVRSLGEAADPALRQAHYTHRHPALFREGGVVPPLWARSLGADTRLIGAVRVRQFQGLFTLRESGLSEPAALRGRRIGLPQRLGQSVDFSRAVSWHGILAWLRRAGLAEDAVTLVDLPRRDPFISAEPAGRGSSLYTARENIRFHTAEVLALSRGDVDAVYLTGPHALEIAALVDAVPAGGNWTGSDPAPEGGDHLRILTASGELVRTRPELAGRYLAVLLRAAAWARTHADDAWRILAAEIGVAEEWAQAGLHPDSPGDLDLTLSEDLLRSLADRAAFLQERGFTESRVDPWSWADPGPLQAASEELAAPDAGAREEAAV
jgi:ABC-type nitrate/sulfonate/bicarbonate transport system substrate-binding protein